MEKYKKSNHFSFGADNQYIDYEKKNSFVFTITFIVECLFCSVRVQKFYLDFEGNTLYTVRPIYNPKLVIL